MELQITFQIFLATALGALIGFERKWKRKSAGPQTYSLVALGSCLFTMIAFQFFESFLGADISFDPSRVIQAVATGIGFIGAGIIFFREDRVEGLTTAAGLWAVAAIGVAIGAKFYFLAVISSFVTLLILAGLGYLEERVFSKGIEKER